MVMTIHIVSDEETHCRSHKCIRRGVPSSRNAGDTDSRCQPVSQNWKKSMLREFSSNDSRECPRLYGMSGRKRIATAEEGDARALGFGPWTLRNRFQAIDEDFSVCQGFNTDSCCIPS